MRYSKLMGCLASMPACGTACCPQHAADSGRPNIIFLLTDDQRWDAFGYAGNPHIHTPNMDSLASNGVYFPNTYATTSISCVSRASILTGMHMCAHGIDNFTKTFTDDQLQNTYPLLLRQAGYYTGFIGKYGVGPTRRYPVKEYDYWRSFPGQGWYWKEKIAGNGEHLTAIQGKQIREFLETRDTEKPFCLSVSFKAPHCQDEMRNRGGDEFPPDLRDTSLYAGVTFPFPETGEERHYNALPEDFRRSPSTGQENEARIRWEKRFSSDSLYQRTVSDYYRLISGVDREIGLMLAELRRHGIEQNTVIVFMGDNGFYLGEHGLAGKWFTHEESVRLPMFIYDPRLPDRRKGVRAEEIALNIDIAPTILSLAGVDIPHRMQGSDLRRVMHGNARGWRKAFYYEHTYNQSVYLPPSEALIGGRYKLTRYFPEGKEWYELYDLRNDPCEKTNLAGDQSYSGVFAQMLEEMQRQKSSVSINLQ